MKIVRNTGYTTYLLKAAINDPNVVVVGSDMRVAAWLRLEYINLYNQMVQKSNWFKRVYLTYIKKNIKEPIFISMDRELRGYSCPVIFDNSCFPTKNEFNQVVNQVK